MTTSSATVCRTSCANTVFIASRRNTVARHFSTTTKCAKHCYYCLMLILTVISSTFFTVTNGSIEGTNAYRNRRQIPASSSGTVNSVGNQTSMSASNSLWKSIDGTVGANGSAIGTAGGPGPSSVLAGSNANVGNLSANGTNAAGTFGGTKSQSSGSSSSMLNGTQAIQLGSGTANAIGTGDVLVNSVGGGSLTNWTQPSQRVGTVGIGGATGNQLASSNISNTYQMSWNTIFARVSGISISKGENNSQANIDLRAGTPTKNMSVDGLVSSVNDKPGGGSFSLASGDGTLINNTAAMSSALVGGVNTTSGGTKMVGASNLESNGTQNRGAINTFGNLRINGTGPGSGGFLSNSSFGPDGMANAGVALAGTQMGTNKSISVSDGINSSDGPSPIVLNGRGTLEGTGNLASNGTSYVLSGYQTGRGTQQIVETAGNSMATNNTASELRINNQGNEMIGKTTNSNASSNAIGRVIGQNSSVTGDAMLNMGRAGGQNGNANMVAQGGGAGPSSAMTDTGLSLFGPNSTVRNTNIRGNVNATGDQTYVKSVSNVSDQNKQQSVFNSQNATVNSAGSGRAMASNSATLKRRKRNSGQFLETLDAMEPKIGGKIWRNWHNGRVEEKQFGGTNDQI